MEFSPAASARTKDYELGPAGTTKVTMESLQEEISIELKKLCGEERAFAWLTSPQELLGLRIPARMIAIGEGLAVLEALRSVRPAV